MTLKVIGAGMPRTATWSQKLALEQLGFGPCYHMSEALQRPEHWPLWVRAAQGEAIDWELIFAGWGSTTDAPGCTVYKALVERYPEAKVLLSARDP
ncbi:MAG TPA: sulfotransferase, partial [Caulobacteraceae bacterium]|nr:sulfotransferase [Caulobacteraceae bacterium]